MNLVALKLTLKNKTYGSDYNAETLEYSLKVYYHFDFPNNARTFVSNTTNAATKVAKCFSLDAEQIKCEIHQLSGAMKYGFGLLENTRSDQAVDDNGHRIELSNSKLKHVSDIFTPVSAFPLGK